MTTTSAVDSSCSERPRARGGKRSLSIRSKLIIPMSLIILVLIGTSFLTTTWLIQRFQYADLRQTLERAGPVVDSLFITQRQMLVRQAQLMGELQILTIVVEDANTATIRDSVQTYKTQLQL